MFMSLIEKKTFRIYFGWKKKSEIFWNNAEVILNLVFRRVSTYPLMKSWKFQIYQIFKDITDICICSIIFSKSSRSYKQGPHSHQYNMGGQWTYQLNIYSDMVSKGLNNVLHGKRWFHISVATIFTSTKCNYIKGLYTISERILWIYHYLTRNQNYPKTEQKQSTYSYETTSKEKDCLFEW